MRTTSRGDIRETETLDPTSPELPSLRAALRARRFTSGWRAHFKARRLHYRPRRACARSGRRNMNHGKVGRFASLSLVTGLARCAGDPQTEIESAGAAASLDAEERDIATVRDFFSPGGEIAVDPSYRRTRRPSADPKELLEELLFERKRNRGIEQDRTAFIAIARFTFSPSLSTALPNATTYGFLPREVARTALSAPDRSSGPGVWAAIRSRACSSPISTRRRRRR